MMRPAKAGSDWPEAISAVHPERQEMP